MCSCLAYVLRDLGEWRGGTGLPRADRLRAGRSSSPRACSAQSTPTRASSAPARRLLTVVSRDRVAPVGHFNMTVDSTAGLAFIAAAEGATTRPLEHCRAILAAGSDSEDHHYALAGLRWSAVFSPRRGDRAGAHECTEALTRIASATGQPDALAALAHAIGETALLDGDADTAAEQLDERARAAPRRSTCRSSAPRSSCAPAWRSRPPASATLALERLVQRLPHGAEARRPRRSPPAAAEVARLGESVAERLGRARGGRRRRCRPLPPRARGHAAGRRRAHQPRDRPRPVPQPAHGGHARAQHPAQARLPLARRGRRRARELGLAG